MRGNRRILIKLSGEALSGPDGKFPHVPTFLTVAQEIAAAQNKGVEIAIVMGGGNIFRGVTGAGKGMNRVSADQIGMLATVQNGIVLHDLLTRVCNVETRLMAGLKMDEVAEPYLPKKAVHHLARGRVIILAGGTGHAYCTTDYAAALRANEIGAHLLAKATSTDGVYDKDPRKHTDANRFSRVSYARCIRDGFEVMDVEAFGLCQKEHMDIRVFSLKEPGNITAVLTGADIGTLVTQTDEVLPPPTV